ncbi:MAG: TIGR04255 family protein [Inquilinaceae bacterium]
MRRPDHLPDFTDPPLDEVVLGVQFAPVPGYASVHSMKVWDLFKAEFLKVQEWPVLEPQFETFGGVNVQAGLRIQVGASPVGSRLWFLSDDENHLIQFQPDRFITNWRREPNTKPYPRFEGLAEAFEVNLRKLADHLESDFGYRVNINQAEVAYINIIPVKNFSEAGDWFELWNGGAFEVEALNTSFNEVIRGADGKPFARLSHQIQSVLAADGKQPAFRLSLTFKGKPAGSDIESAMAFLVTGRDAVVTRFGEITTKEAQTKWGRVE